MTPDNILTSITACNGEFTHQNTSASQIKLRIRHNNNAPTTREGKPNNSNAQTYPQRTYHRNNETRFEDIQQNTTRNIVAYTTPTTPTIDQRIHLTLRVRNGIATDTNYRGTLQWRVERKSGTSRITAETSSYSSNTNSYTFTSTDNGQVTLSNAIRLTNPQREYRIAIYDTTTPNTQQYLYIQPYNNQYNNRQTNTTNFVVSTNNSIPRIDQRVHLTIRARNNISTDTNYRGTVYPEIRYRMIGNTTRTKTTSSHWYEIRSPYENNGISFSYTDNGQTTISNFIRFKQAGYEYKVVVVDTNTNKEGFQTFTIEGNTNTSSNFLVTTNNDNPNTNQWTNLFVRARNGTSTNTNYRGTISIDVYYQEAGSISRTKTTSSQYYALSNTLNNGYTFYSTQNGYVSISNAIIFYKHNHRYKIVVYDKNTNSIQGEKIFNVQLSNTPSNIAGFTLAQIETIQAIYNQRDSSIQNLKNTYPNLRTHTRWTTVTNTFKQNMKDVLDKKSTRTFKTYATFHNAYLSRQRYTDSVK